MICKNNAVNLIEDISGQCARNREKTRIVPEEILPAISEKTTGCKGQLKESSTAKFIRIRSVNLQNLSRA